MSNDQNVDAKRKCEALAEEASAREYHRRRHNFQVRLNNGRRAAVAPPPASGAPTSDVASGATELQRASFDLLSALTPTRASDLQSEIDAEVVAYTEVDETDFLNSLVLPLDADTASQPP
jgi:hypothetical protein